jgi:hypothetical protein
LSVSKHSGVRERFGVRTNRSTRRSRLRELGVEAVFAWLPAYRLPQAHGIQRLARHPNFTTITFASGLILANNLHMVSFRFVSLICILPLASLFAAAPAPTSVAPAQNVAIDESLLTGSTYIPPAMPLSRIAVYSMAPVDATGDEARLALSSEIDRLYTYAKTLSSGPDRRALETRIYLFEKRLRPLAQAFDVNVWSQLRADVRAEWLSVQATLPGLVASNG